MYIGDMTREAAVRPHRLEFSHSVGGSVNNIITMKVARPRQAFGEHKDRLSACLATFDPSHIAPQEFQSNA